VDPLTGRGKVLEHGTYDTVGWDVDLAGGSRTRVDVDELSRAFSVQVRAKGVARWTELERGADVGELQRYMAYSDPDDGVYMREIGPDAERVVLKKLGDGSIQPVGQPTPGATPGLIIDPYRSVAVAVIGGADKPAVQWLDPELGAVHATLARAFKDQTVSLTNWSKDRTRFIARVSAPASPGAWYLYDKPRKELSPLGDEYPELKGAAFGATRWVVYKARDGLQIGAYYTTPAGMNPGSTPPLIVLPHGGPGSRDDYDFDFLTEFLVSRGYAVLRPQFRGSTGFGRAFYEAGRGEWGGKMQTDLLDGVTALAAEGAVDPTRVCIVGWSFGGYAALAGAALHPGAYRCAASFAGVSDLKMLLAQEAATYGHETSSFHALRKMLGRDGPNSPQLVATSPLQQVANIRAPILLMHAEKDTIVAPVQSQAMAEALRDAGKPVEFLMLADDDHYLRRSETRTRMLEALERFLAKNLPVGG
jgi:dipeptidyl aminopeptidase/acylaminoacyl peptidase